MASTSGPDVVMFGALLVLGVLFLIALCYLLFQEGKKLKLEVMTSIKLKQELKDSVSGLLTDPKNDHDRVLHSLATTSSFEEAADICSQFVTGCLHRKHMSQK